VNPAVKGANMEGIATRIGRPRRSTADPPGAGPPGARGRSAWPGLPGLKPRPCAVFVPPRRVEYAPAAGRGPGKDDPTPAIATGYSSRFSPPRDSDSSNPTAPPW